jgi:hypothetical protein
VTSTKSCGSKEQLVLRVKSRLPGARFVEQEGELRVHARFTPGEGGRTAGELFLVREGEDLLLRALEATSCDDAVDGIALILAVTLDPTIAIESEAEPAAASLPSTPPGSEGQQGAPTSAGSPSNSEPRATASLGNEYPSDPGSVPDYLADDEAESPKSRADAPWFVSGTIGGEGAWGPAPQAMPGVSGYVMVGLAAPSVWSPAVAIGGVSLWSPDLEQPGGTASFTLDAVTLDGCPVRFAFRPFEARACASALIGRFAATGSNTRNPTSTTRPFVALGGLGVLAWDVGSHVEVSARLAPRANLYRDDFEFAERVFRAVPALTLSASLGVGLRWP